MSFDDIFVLIGFEPSLDFMEKIKIKLTKTYEPKDFLGILFVGFIFLWVLSYNKGVKPITTGFESLSPLLNLNNISNEANVWGIIFFCLFFLALLLTIYFGIKNIIRIKKKSYRIFIGVMLLIWFLVGMNASYNLIEHGSLFHIDGSLETIPFWHYYTVFYSVIVSCFGFWSMLKYTGEYIWARTLSLFILPIIVLQDWRVFSLIYVWPLGPYALTAASPPVGSMLTFITEAHFIWIGIILSFIVFTCLVYYKGRGAVCSWICGCGALAETLGDPFRTKTPQGEKSKWLEYGSFFLLGFSAIATCLKAYAEHLQISAGDMFHLSIQTPIYTIVPLFTIGFMWYTWFKIKNRIMSYAIILGVFLRRQHR